MASIPFSNTTTKTGHIQKCEFWCNLGDAGISGDATLVKIFTGLINDAYDRLMPRLLVYLKHLGYDDINNTGLPFDLTNLTSGTSVYSITTDDNSNESMVLLKVAILPTSSSTQYVELEQISADDPDAPFYVSPNSQQTGIPTKVLILGRKLFFNVIPNYSATNGIKTFMVREHKAFASTDTTAVASIPLPFQSLLSVYASHDWVIVNKPDQETLISRLEAEIQKREKELQSFISTTTNTREVMTPSLSSYL